MALKHSKFVVGEGALSAALPTPTEDQRAAPPKRQRKTELPASRQGMVPFGFFVPPEARRQLKGWAGMHGRTTQDIGQEMMDDWFAKNGLHRLAGSSER
jgi:hypothetical protein